ncbi:nSTAND1 domain-containing NTPase [Streptomyces muensis]|uniref:nSTAND1 domain-containing NTPase n=1 Tax=Streptomyces muensis TaxID=1077944 RepID=UPI003FD8386C
MAVLQGYVRACGGDTAEWELRWKAVEAETAQAAIPGDEGSASPYRGLARFEPDHRDLFFGRDRLIGEVRTMVCGHRFAVVFGASGSGKSSLLRAGLIPCLREEIARRDRPAVLRILTPGPRPATTHGQLLTPAQEEPESWVVVDQFEEVFTLCQDRAERTRFIDLLLTAQEPDSRLRVLIAVRADFYARCTEHRGLAEAVRAAGMPVGPMTAAELREVVTRPAQAVGLLVERELTARIVDDVLDQPGALPMLSHALLETWRRRRGRLMTLSAYEAAGGVSGAIAATAEQEYAQLSPGQQGRARQLLLRLVEPGHDAPDTRRPLTRAELDEWLDPEARSVVERLARARLLTSDSDGLQIAHEALISGWPRLRDWIEQNRERLRLQRRLTEATRTWLEHDRDPGSLYRGTRLAQAEELFADDSSLTASERSFLQTAIEAREAERQTAARSVRRSRVLVVWLSVMLVVALVAGLSAWQQALDDRQRRVDTAARRAASVADSLRSTDPRTAMLLGVAAWRVAQLPETRRALLGSLVQPEQDTFIDPSPSLSGTRFLADSGRTLLSVDGRAWRTWDVATGHRTGSGRVPDGDVIAAAPDARVLAIDGGDGVQLWDTVTRQWTGAPKPASTIADFGASGRSHVVVDTGEDRVQLRSVADDSVLFESRGAGRTEVRPDADDRLVAVCPAGKAPQVWDIVARRALSGAWENARGSCDGGQTGLVFGGARLAALSGNEVRVWDTGSGRLIASLDAPGVRYAVFDRETNFLATSDGQEIKVWRLSRPDAPVFRHALNNQQPYGLAWDPDLPVLRYLEGSTVHSLDLAQAVASGWREHPLAGEMLSPDGRVLATAERSGTDYRFRLRNARDGRVLQTLPSPPLPVSRDRTQPVFPQKTLALLAFSPDSTAFAYGVSAPNLEAAPQRLTVWDLRRARARATLDLATAKSAAPVIAVALGPGGRTLYTARTPGDFDGLSNETWDVASHRRTGLLPGRAGHHLAVSSDGHLFVSDERAVRAGKSVTRDLVQGYVIGALAFAPDGSRLAAGDLTGRVVLWDSDLRRRAGTLRNVFPAPLGDTPEAVSALVFSPDGSTLAVGGSAGTLQLWDTATQQPLGGPVTTPGERIDTLAFSADNGTLYAGSAHVPLQRYTVGTAQALNQVCARADGAELTRDQWHMYIPDAPYREVCGT